MRCDAMLLTQSMKSSDAWMWAGNIQYATENIAPPHILPPRPATSLHARGEHPKSKIRKTASSMKERTKDNLRPLPCKKNTSSNSPYPSTGLIHTHTTSLQASKQVCKHICTILNLDKQSMYTRFLFRMVYGQHGKTVMVGLSQPAAALSYVPIHS